MRKGTLARLNWMWLKGTVPRNQFPSIWWAGYKAAHVGHDDTTPKGMTWNEGEVEAFKSGYDYYKEVNDA